MQYIDPATSPAYQLWLASNAWQRRVRKVLEPFNITHVQFVILAAVDHLTRGGAEPTQVAVCRFGALDENMTSQVVRTLLDKGLLVREPHPTDGRAHVLALTDQGKSLTQDARSAVKPVSNEFFAPLGERIQDLTSLLREINVDRE